VHGRGISYTLLDTGVSGDTESGGGGRAEEALGWFYLRPQSRQISDPAISARARGGPFSFSSAA
jgi:hypothetical protein